MLRRWLEHDRIWLWGIFLASLVALAPALRNTYTLDDRAQVQRMEVPVGLVGWARACTEGWWINNPHFHLWRPVTRLSIMGQKAMLQSMATERQAWTFYAYNLLLHGAVGLLLFLVGRRLGLGRAAAGLGALIFAVHPLHAEAVHQIVGRADLWVAFWMLAGLLLLLQGGLRGANGLRGAHGMRGARCWLLQPLIYALALGSKENGVLYAPIVFLAVWAGAVAEPVATETLASWRRWLAPLRQGRLWGLMGLFACVLALYLLGKVAVTGGVMEERNSIYENPLGFMAFWQRLPAALGLLGYAASRLVWPAGLSPDYTAISFPFERGWGWGWSWAGLGLLGATVILMIRSARRGGRGWALAAAALVLYSLISNGPFPIGAAAAQRLWYLPSAPACLGLGWALALVYERMGRARRRLGALALTAPIILIIALGTLIALAWSDAGAWRSPDDFYHASLARFPQNRRGLIALAAKGFNDRDYQSGYDYASKLVAYFPGDMDGWGYRGGCAMHLPGHQGEAEGDLQRALALDQSAGCWVRPNYADLLEMQGRYAEAARQLEQYLSAPNAQYRVALSRRLQALKAKKQENISKQNPR